MVGNSVHSLGIVRGITSGLKTLSGGEIGSITQLIVNGRHAAISRLEAEAKDEAASGLTGVTSDLRKLGDLMEFIAVGSAVKSTDGSTGPFFSTACSGQDLYLPGQRRLPAPPLRDRQRRLCPGDRPGDLAAG